MQETRNFNKGANVTICDLVAQLEGCDSLYICDQLTYYLFIIKEVDEMIKHVLDQGICSPSNFLGSIKQLGNLPTRCEVNHFEWLIRRRSIC